MKSKHLSVIIAVLILISAVSLLLTYGPIAKVEAIYQFTHFLQKSFHVTDVRALVLPEFEFNYSTSRHPEFGMTIPKLYIDEPIIFNVDATDPKAYQPALSKGIAHAAGTQLPGEKGLSYYFAHSSQPNFRNQYNAIFYLLGKLEKGDDIYIWKDGVKHIYKVTEEKVTLPTDLSFLSTQYDNETIVLQTCWPPGSDQKRLLVFAQKEL
jgi:LPXTG-site transpeptidase (sortase) family protein